METNRYFLSLLSEEEPDAVAIIKGETFFAFHIHETGDCSRNFTNTGNHFNPDNVSHPEHAGEKIACGVITKNT